MFGCYGQRSGLAFAPFFATRDRLATNATYWNTWMCHVVFEVRVGCAVTNVKLRDF